MSFGIPCCTVGLLVVLFEKSLGFSLRVLADYMDVIVVLRCNYNRPSKPLNLSLTFLGSYDSSRHR